MTIPVTPSATDQGLVGDTGWSVYAPAPAGVGYTIRHRDSFALALSRNGEKWTVVDRVTGIFGVADSPTAALEDFRSAAEDHLDVLERQEALAEHLVAQRNYLRRRLNA